MNNRIYCKSVRHVGQIQKTSKFQIDKLFSIYNTKYFTILNTNICSIFLLQLVKSYSILIAQDNSLVRLGGEG